VEAAVEDAAVVEAVEAVEDRPMNTTEYNESKEELYIPRTLLLQWHITERCNLRCAHCYQESYSGKELAFGNLLRILEQYKDLLQLWRARRQGQPVRGHITVTGGEPFVRTDFFDLLKTFHDNRQYFTFAVLTNGSYVNAESARRLSDLEPSFVQVSIEGTRQTHDTIRGRGNYERTVAAVKHLTKANIRTFISFTAHRDNFREFSDVARLGMKLGVARVWSDRLIPSGSGSALAGKMLTPEQTLEFFEIMRAAQTEANESWFNKTEIAMHRALQFLVGGGKPYHCTAGDSLITVQPNGDLYPCRRMPIIAGNLTKQSLTELYYESEILRTLRDRTKLSDRCQSCLYATFCRGGLKCLSYAITKNPFSPDPACPL
jgi:radical SAM protein with 4Fe4S-binding SPASM domain